MIDLPLLALERPAQPAPGQQPWLLVLMHGVGSNEQDLFGLASFVPPQFHVLSLRARFPWGPVPMPGSSSRWMPTARATSTHRRKSTAAPWWPRPCSRPARGWAFLPSVPWRAASARAASWRSAFC